MNTPKNTKHYKYRVMSWAKRNGSTLYDRRFWPQGEWREVTRRHFNNVETMNEYVFMQQLLGRTVEVMNMHQFNEIHSDNPDAILIYYRLMNHNRISEARKFFSGEINIDDLPMLVTGRLGAVARGGWALALKKLFGSKEFQS